MKYLAFLSYSSKDRRLAEQLQKKLESFRIPPAAQTEGVAAALPEKLGKIFRDRTDLAAAPSLAATLQAALAESRHLIVLCSPDAAAPASWVNNEIRYFRQLRPDGKILAVILAGQPPGVFPSELLITEQPLAADLRPEGDGPDDGLLKVVAALLDLDFDRLRRRHEEAAKRQRRKRATFAGIYGVVVTAALIAIGYQAFDLARSRDESIASAAKAANDSGRYESGLLLALAALPERWLGPSPSPHARAQLERALLNNRLRMVIQAPRQLTGEAALDAERGYLLVATSSGEVLVFSLETGQQLSTLQGPAGWVSAVALAADGRSLAIAYQREIQILSWPRAELRYRFTDAGRQFTALALSDDSRWLVGGDEHGRSTVWDLLIGTPSAIGPDQRGRTLGAVFSADGERILTSSFANSVVEWRRDSGLVVRNYPFEHSTPGRVFRQPVTGFWVTLLAGPGPALFWNPATGEDVKYISPGHHIEHAAFSRDGAWMLAGGWERKASVIDTRSSRILDQFEHPDWVDFTGMVFSDHALVTVSHDAKIRVWDSPLPFAPSTYFKSSCSGPALLAARSPLYLTGTFDGAVHRLNASGDLIGTLAPPTACAPDLKQDFSAAILAALPLAGSSARGRRSGFLSRRQMAGDRRLGRDHPAP